MPLKRNGNTAWLSFKHVLVTFTLINEIEMTGRNNIAAWWNALSASQWLRLMMRSKWWEATLQVMRMTSDDLFCRLAGLELRLSMTKARRLTVARPYQSQILSRWQSHVMQKSSLCRDINIIYSSPSGILLYVMIISPYIVWELKYFA